MRIRGKVNLIAFDANKLSKTVQELIKGSVREAAREFYRTAWFLIPVDTGMARGSLIPLGRHLRNIPTKINPKRDFRPPTTGYPRGKSKEEGISLGEGAFTSSERGFQYRFSFRVVVRHHDINDDKWQSMEMGFAAAQNRLREENLNKKIVAAFKDAINLKGGITLDG